MTTHPEQHENEKFVGNTKLTDWPNPLTAGLKTIRLGQVAYDISGTRLSEMEGMRPVFVGRSDLNEYDRIRMAELSRIATGK